MTFPPVTNPSGATFLEARTSRSEELHMMLEEEHSAINAIRLPIGCMVSPPKPGDISYDQYLRECTGILESLRKRAHMMTDGFNSCKNVVCNFTEGQFVSQFLK
ncbi:glutamate--glyoxylate aminotransferase 2-like [Helianthus annuus]|uniref:glutamate--glyoxylate aminotransferase 2-like n=1 Tax=Helianthus annuus TaxID=4232 RepID=UPI001652CA7F|nr:glutamate--glyoxylate aminotransferase 2-like [Helianthus annuus]